MTTIHLTPYDPAWPRVYADQAGRIAAALGPDALRLEHAGSTAVPGLAAKPVIDIVLDVADPADEAAYVPRLEAAGFAFALREPGWFDHRLLTRREPAVNLHVFAAGCPETGRMLAFRDHLRRHSEDRALYARTKAELALRDWPSVDAYAAAKSAVVADILARAMAAQG